MNRLHEEGMAQDKVDSGFPAQIANPVQGKHTLHSNHLSFSKKLKSSHKYVRISIDVFVENDLSLLIDDAGTSSWCEGRFRSNVRAALYRISSGLLFLGVE